MTSPTMSAMFGTAPVETFLGLPAEAPAPRAALIGVPCATPYPSVGAYCAGAPRAIRAAIAEDCGNRAHVDFDFGEPLLAEGEAVDLGDLACDPATPVENRALIRDTVRDLVARGITPILIGGDDSIPIPMLEAFTGRGPITLVQIDAHIDWRDEVGGERLGLSSTMRRASEMPQIGPMIQIGQRSVGSARAGDLADARAHGVQFISARDIARFGITPALSKIPEGAETIVCFDFDALDPAIMPGVIGRAPGGLGYWQAVELLRGIAAKSRILAFDFVEYMPERDVDAIGGLTAARLIVQAIGIAVRQGRG